MEKMKQTNNNQRSSYHFIVFVCDETKSKNKEHSVVRGSYRMFVINSEPILDEKQTTA